VDNKLIIGLAVLAGAALILSGKKPKPVTSGLSGAAELAG
jgi:hypothetical protein